MVIENFNNNSFRVEIRWIALAKHISFLLWKKYYAIIKEQAKKKGFNISRIHFYIQNYFAFRLNCDPYLVLQ